MKLFLTVILDFWKSDCHISKQIANPEFFLQSQISENKHKDLGNK